MPIKVVCSGCGRTLNARDEHAGKKLKCPACAAIVAVPAVAADIDQLEEVEAVATPERRPSRDDDYDARDDDRGRERRPRRDDYDDRDDDRGRRSRGGARTSVFARQGLTSLGTILFFSAVGMLVLLFVSVFFPWRAMDLAIGPPKMGGFGNMPKIEFPKIDIPNMPMPGMPQIDFPKIDVPNMPMPGMPGMRAGGSEVILSGKGLEVPVGIITLIVSLLAIAFVVVALFVLNRSMFKNSLRTAFALSLGCALLALLAAVGRRGEGFLVERGAWGAWVAMFVAVIAAGLFIATLVTIPRLATAKRPASRDDDD